MKSVEYSQLYSIFNFAGVRPEYFLYLVTGRYQKSRNFWTKQPRTMRFSKMYHIDTYQNLSFWYIRPWKYQQKTLGRGKFASSSRLWLISKSRLVICTNFWSLSEFWYLRNQIILFKANNSNDNKNASTQKNDDKKNICFHYPTVVNVTIVHQNPVAAPERNLAGKSLFFQRS